MSSCSCVTDARHANCAKSIANDATFADNNVSGLPKQCRQLADKTQGRDCEVVARSVTSAAVEARFSLEVGALTGERDR